MADTPLAGSAARVGSSFTTDLLLAILPALVLFLVLPVELYLPNQGEFDYNLAVLLPYPVLLVLWVLSFVVLFLFLRPGRRAAIALAMFWCGLFFLLSDIVAPVQLGLLDGTQRQPAEPLELTIRELALAAAILLAAWKTPALWTRQFGIAFAVLLVLFQPIRFWHGFSPAAPSLNKYDSEFKTHPPPSVLSSKPNVYHITWDAHSSHAFDESLREDGISQAFDGFIFFKENRSNYAFTTLSAASYMTGSFYQEGRMSEWVGRRFRGGVAEELYRAGFEVWEYLPSLNFVHQRASHVATQFAKMAEGHPLIPIASFADLWLVRAVPNFLQDEVYFDGKGAASRLVPALEPLLLARPPTAAGEESQAFYSVALARQLIEEEHRRPARGQYVYAHIYLPHGPFILNEECEYAPQADSSVEEKYYRQGQCATKLMLEFIRELKRLGRYEESAIIFHSDHAIWEYGPRDPHKAQRNLRNALQIQDNVRGMSPAGIDNVVHSLLLVKPAGQAGVPLEISERPAQLADIPATIYDMLSVVPEVPIQQGQSVLGKDFPDEREIHLFFDFVQVDKDGREIILGRDFQEGELNHFSYTASAGWKRYPNLPVKW